MASDKIPPEALIERLGWRPDYILYSTINIRETLLIPSLNTNPSSSIGHMDCLLTELLSLIFNMLDILSLSRFAHVSRRANAIITTLPAYRDLKEYASKTL